MIAGGFKISHNVYEHFYELLCQNAYFCVLMAILWKKNLQLYHAAI